MQLPIYNSSKGITTEVPNNIRSLEEASLGARNLKNATNSLMQLQAQWQASKDEVQNLDAKNKLQAGILAISNEAINYNEYSSPEELQTKEQELTQKMQELTSNIVSGFSNNRNAQQFQSNADLIVQQNIYKLQDVFRKKYGDIYNSNLQISADNALNGFTQTGNEAYKQQYYEAIDTGVKAGYLTNSEATNLKLSTDEWNYDYVYSKVMENPYFKASDEVMSKIPPVKQRALQNLQKNQQKMAKADALNNAINTFMLNPNEKNLQAIYRINPKLKGSKKFEEMLTTPNNYETVSNIEGKADAIAKIKELSDIDTSSYNGKMEYSQKAGDIAYAIFKNNTDVQGNATISEKDKSKLYDLLTKQLNDVSFKEKLKDLPDLQALKGFELRTDVSNYQLKNWNMDKETFLEQNQKNIEKLQEFEKNDGLKGYLNAQRKLSEVQKITSEMVLDFASVGDMESAKKIYNKGLQEAIRLKYWYIPELQKGELQAGQQFTVNGKVYTFQGYTAKDIIVESK